MLVTVDKAMRRLRAAREADQLARERADDARAALRDAALAAVAAGIPRKVVAEEAGVTRRAVYQWIEGSGQA